MTMTQNTHFVESFGDCQLWTNPPGDPFLSLFCRILKNVPQKPKLTATSGTPKLKGSPFMQSGNFITAGHEVESWHGCTVSMGGIW